MAFCNIVHYPDSKMEPSIHFKAIITGTKEKEGIDWTCLVQSSMLQ
jgi:hypothetical protein